MYRNILVAVDGSHTSEIALQEAVKLTKELNGQLRIVHVVETINHQSGWRVYQPQRSLGCHAQ